MKLEGHKPTGVDIRSNGPELTLKDGNWSSLSKIDVID
jgi:hypothetical protein